MNGYAALKELESYMSIPASPGRTEEFYSTDGVTTIECNSTNCLFDYPVLISGTYEESKSMMAESIINLAIESTGTFSQNSFYSNSDANRVPGRFQKILWNRLCICGNSRSDCDSKRGEQCLQKTLSAPGRNKGKWSITSFLYRRESHE